MQGKIRSNCCSDFFFFNSFNIYKLLSLHFTGVVLLQMVTATVQCKRQQQEQNKATETQMCCNTHHSWRNRCEPHLQVLGADRLPKQQPGAPRSASAPEPQYCAPPRSSSCPAQAPLSQHPTPTGSHPWRPQGQVSPEAISCAVWTPRGRGRAKDPAVESYPWPISAPPPTLDTPGQRETRSAALSALLQCAKSLNGNELDFWSMHFSSCWKGKRRTTHTPG